ncbi:MAG: mannitol-1-phosphate 5-dehydrogenase [Spirochaetes bacterium]|nr:mannitol-1-phosphate 5-dehydrogenase [Spirochaetota bacterium]
MKLVHFGAGRIGRSFIGALFSAAGWDVVFVDIDEAVIDALNRNREYRIQLKGDREETVVVRHVRGIHADNEAAVSEEVSEADLVSTAVGKQKLDGVAGPLAAGIVKRYERFPKRPLDIVLCENMRNAAGFFRKSLERRLPPSVPDSYVGYVETSIGKMVPLMSAEKRREDPLLVYAERYNTLIVDKKGFRGPIPKIRGLEPKSCMEAWVARKLYVHNLGHAVLAYTSFAFFPEYRYVWEAMSNRELAAVTKNAMWESGRALISEYPSEFDETGIRDHIEDLLERFSNRALGDTIYRVGLDLKRKLSADDRLVGAIRLCVKHRIPPVFISFGTAAALFFRAAGEDGRMYEPDRRFIEKELSGGVERVIEEVCGLAEREEKERITEFYQKIERGEIDPDTLLREET